MLSKLRFIVPVAAIAAAIDLLSKEWAVGRLRTGLPIEVIEHFFHFRYCVFHVGVIAEHGFRKMRIKIFES